MAEAALSLVRDCEAAELAALLSFHESLPPAIRAAAAVGHRMVGAGLLVHASPDVLAYNRVLGLGVSEPARETDVDETILEFQKSGARRFMIQAAPGAEPAAFTGWLGARGFYHHNHWVRLVRDLRDPVPEARTDLRLAKLGLEHAEAFGRLQAEAYGHPPELAMLNSGLIGTPGWECFGAFDGGELVATSAVRPQGAVAWFGFAATDARYRRRGAQSALIATRLAAALAAGCRWACVETAADTPEKPNPSTHNLRRLGFRDAYERPNWVKVLKEG